MIRDESRKAEPRHVGKDLVKFEVDSGVAFLSSLCLHEVERVTPGDTWDRMRCQNTVDQQNKEGTATTFMNITSRFSLLGIEAPSFETGVADCPGLCFLPNSTHTARRADPPLSPLFTGFVERVRENVADAATSIGSIMSGPTVDNLGSLTFLASVIMRNDQAWMDVAP
ncbi:unnamed protein product [Nippostrongylus brasiliensis]|uniref:PEROXIDASE_4 domain-containing protein n=1 Tax=Nippostrongylus brasiliensis TaxID=27835 RepID=A0A0N4YL11_NIPBR|nr:unnamed protein product [Nippostrongylus brasiliensis]